MACSTSPGFSFFTLIYYYYNVNTAALPQASYVLVDKSRVSNIPCTVSTGKTWFLRPKLNFNFRGHDLL